MAGWYVGKFLEDNSVEVIPSNWLLSFSECVWPNNFGPVKTSGAIRNSLKPGDDWKKWSIKILSKTLLTEFENATTIANKAQLTSDCDTLTIQEPNQLKRKRFPKKNKDMVISLSASDEELSNKNTNSKYISKPLPDFPQIKKNNVFSNVHLDEYNNTNNVSVFQELNDNNQEINAEAITAREIRWDGNEFEDTLDKSINISEELSMIDEENGRVGEFHHFETSENNSISMRKVDHSNKQVYESVPSSSMMLGSAEYESYKEFQNQVLRQLVTLNARSKENAEYLHILMLNVNDVKEKIDMMSDKSSTSALKADDKALSDIFSKFPIYNNDLMDYVTNVVSDQNMDKLVHMLALMGGSDYKELTRRILRKMITDEMAALYSFTGHKGKGVKKAFNKTILSTLLCKAVQAKFTTTTVKEVENAASIWLTKACDRLKNKSS